MCHFNRLSGCIRRLSLLADKRLKPCQFSPDNLVDGQPGKAPWLAFFRFTHALCLKPKEGAYARIDKKDWGDPGYR